MTNEMNKYDAAVAKIASGFAAKFVEHCQGDERLNEVLMDLAATFVTEEMPIVSEDSQIDVACELIMSVTLTTVS